MPTEVANYLSAGWSIFFFSFLVALTGAMAPGPLLTYTIFKSVGAAHRGYLMGLWIILGHAILEMGVIIFLLLGFSFVLENIIVVRVIGVVGGLILVCFGVSIFLKVYSGNVADGFPESSDIHQKEFHKTGGRGLGNPVVGGIAVSMSNPYWWVWWATIGLAFITQFDISFRRWPQLLAFFLGHEAGDLLWYLAVSSLAFFGMRRLSRKSYYKILMLCAGFMVIFGLYLGVSPFLKDQI